MNANHASLAERQLCGEGTLDLNPYASPVDLSREDAPAVVPGMTVTTRGKRFLTYFLDYVFYMVFSVLVGIFLGIACILAGLDEEAIYQIPETPLGVAILLFYYVPQEALWGRTLGKIICGTKVVRLDGGKPTTGQIIGRTLCRMIPFEQFSFLGGKGHPVGWHDRLSKTRVVTSR